MREDLKGMPGGDVLSQAMDAFRADVGRTKVGDLLGQAAPVSAELNVGKLRRWEKNRDYLAKRLPPETMAQLEQLISDAQKQGKYVPGTYPIRLAWARVLSLGAGSYGIEAGHSWPARALEFLGPPAAQLIRPAYRAYKAVGANPAWLNTGATLGGTGLRGLLSEQPQ